MEKDTTDRGSVQNVKVVLRCPACGAESLSGDPEVSMLAAVASIKAEAVQAERERIALLFEDRDGWGNVGAIAASIVRGEG